MKITTKGSKLTVTLEDGRTATVPFDPSSSMISSAGRAVFALPKAWQKHNPND